MFITRINRMFHKHGRVAFAILTVVIIIPFVLYFSAAPSELLDIFRFGGKSSDVQMYGKTVSQDVLDTNITNTMISTLLQGYNIDFDTMRDNSHVIQEALKRIRLLKVVDAKNIKVDDMQIAIYLRSLPVFQTKGQFNVNMYNMYMQYFLAKYNFGIKDFENAIRENLQVDILKKQLGEGVVVTEAAAREFYNTSNETYNVKVARLNTSDYKALVKVDDKALENYFNSNRDKYKIPVKCKADVVRFNFINYEPKAAKNVTDKQVNDNYKQNVKLYKKMTEVAAKEKIKKDLINQECDKMAKRDAQEFAVAVFKQIEKKHSKSSVSIFDEYASKSKFTVQKIADWVDAKTEVVPRLGKVPEVVQAIIGLYKDQPITNAVLGKNAYFVACLVDKQSERRAELSEVKDKVRTDFIDVKALELAKAAAKDLSDKVADALKNKRGVPVVFKEFPAFSQANPTSVFKEKSGYNVLQAAMETQKGSISKIADTSDGPIVVYVDKITPPPPSDFDKQKDENLNRYRTIVQQSAWANYLSILEKESNTVNKTPTKNKQQ